MNRIDIFGNCFFVLIIHRKISNDFKIQIYLSTKPLIAAAFGLALSCRLKWKDKEI